MLPKILVISNYNDKHTVRPEAEVFISLQKMGFKVFIMTYPGTFYYDRFIEQGIHVIPFHPTKKRDRKAIRKIRDTIIRYDINILHLFNRTAYYSGIPAAKGLPVKVVLYRGYTSKIAWWDPKAYRLFLHPRVDKIVCLTDLIKDDIAKTPFFDTEKLITIHKGHDVNWYADVNKADLQKEFGIPKNAFSVVNVANERQMKGTKYLIKSSYFLAKNAEIHYIIIGKKRDKRKNLKLAENSPMKDKIHFAGFRKDVLSIVKACDVSVMSSTGREGIPKTVVESMCVETPAIITNIFGNFELVKDNECGYIIPIKNSKAIAHAINELYNNQAKCHEFGKKARIYIDQNLHTDKTVRETAIFYQSIFLNQHSL